MTIQVKEMTTAQMYRADSAPQAPKSALRGRMQRLGLALLAFTLVIGVAGSASAGQTQDEAAVRALGDNFAKAFVQKGHPFDSEEEPVAGVVCQTEYEISNEAAHGEQQYPPGPFDRLWIDHAVHDEKK